MKAFILLTRKQIYEQNTTHEHNKLNLIIEYLHTPCHIHPEFNTQLPKNKVTNELYVSKFISKAFNPLQPDPGAYSGSHMTT